MADLYEILGVDENANDKALKKAYRLKAKALHPDVNSAEDAEEKFQNVHQAYLILSDPEKRAIYDRGFEVPEVKVQERPKYPPPHAFRNRRTFDSWLNGEEIYSPKIEYEQYAKAARIAGIVTFLFASTFLIDFLLYQEYKDLTVTRVQTKASITRKFDDLGIVIVDAGDFKFEKKRVIDDEFRPGEKINIRKSLIYGYYKYQRSNEDRFTASTILGAIVYFVALLIYLTSLIAIFNKTSPEAKFNGALIAGFFSLALFVFVLLT